MLVYSGKRSLSLWLCCVSFCPRRELCVLKRDLCLLCIALLYVCSVLYCGVRERIVCVSFCSIELCMCFVLERGVVCCCLLVYLGVKELCVVLFFRGSCVCCVLVHVKVRELWMFCVVKSWRGSRMRCCALFYWCEGVYFLSQGEGNVVE